MLRECHECAKRVSLSCRYVDKWMTNITQMSLADKIDGGYKIIGLLDMRRKRFKKNIEKVANNDRKKEKEKEIKKENGEWQSTVYNRTVAPNSYEVGTAGNRFKLYFETPQDLKDKMKELRDAGLMDMPIDIPTGE